ncbi:bacterial regulatory helix-turn-helix protein, LysR family protein 182 [Achromobacter xylosoxidans A8]|uniref:Bacterial regulatory helix-turn-helix protein, LysR family protein 182 n=1 Tax=Achromobacter xylosoxidans (strain A8) TaxID=762376 RepID=E3HH75_ACHXA|nr:LysR substrate-binding domain-containing protein [Achromobacter xylosoxidans]ADP19025.1 bacterial regulatory helix-turn-helix protein, LysR family protein 182 [Achromobacter xylosoxidans A8]
MSAPLKIQHLRQFLLAADHGSFRLAAEGTFRSQAAVSAAMQDLEQQLGAPLFEPGKRAQLTPLGLAVAPLFRELLVTHDRVLDAARQFGLGSQGPVSLAVMPSLADEWLPRLLERYARSHPAIRIRAIDESSQDVHRLVLSGEVQVGVAGQVPRTAEVAFAPVARDAFGLVCRKSHPLARRRGPVPWAALAGERLIGNATFDTLKNRQLGGAIEDPFMVVSNRASLLASVVSGLGVTVLPVLARPAAASGLAFVPLAEPTVERIVGVLTRKEETLLPSVAAMHALALRSLAQFTRRKGAILV